jgi:hypothetical protein
MNASLATEIASEAGAQSQSSGFIGDRDGRHVQVAVNTA